MCVYIKSYIYIYIYKYRYILMYNICQLSQLPPFKWVWSLSLSEITRNTTSTHCHTLPHTATHCIWSVGNQSPSFSSLQYKSPRTPSPPLAPFLLPPSPLLPILALLLSTHTLFHTHTHTCTYCVCVCVTYSPSCPPSPFVTRPSLPLPLSRMMGWWRYVDSKNGLSPFRLRKWIKSLKTPKMHQVPSEKSPGKIVLFINWDLGQLGSLLATATPYIWLDAFMWVACLMYVCVMSQSCAWHDSSIRVTWLIHMCHTRDSRVWYDAFIYVKWLLRKCFMTHSVQKHKKKGAC